MTKKLLDPVAVNSDKNAFLTIEQIRARLNLKRGVAYKIANPELGEIPSIRVGKLIHVSLAALNDFIAKKLGEPDTDLRDIEFFNVKQIKAYGFARSTVYGLVQSGKLRAIRFGSVIMVPSHWLDEFLKQCGYAPRISHQARVASHQIE